MVTVSFIKLSIFLGIMSCQTKRYWTIYSTSKGEFQLNLGNLINVLVHICFIIIDLLRQLQPNNSLIAYCRRYDKRLKPPSEGALRVRTSHHSHCNVFLVSFPNMFQTEFTTLIFSLCNFVSMKILSDQHQHVSPLPLFSGRVKSSLRD